MALTDLQVRRAKPREKLYKLYDEDGLYLEVPPKGKPRWRSKYTFMGKENRLSQGTYPLIGLKEARERNVGVRKLLEQGIDPSRYRKQRKLVSESESANTFELLTREWYAKFLPTWTKSHSDRLIRLFERDLFPWIGKEPISEVTPQQLLAVVQRIEARGALETAHRALGNCKQVFRYAMNTMRADKDPTQNLLKALPSYKRKHFAAQTDPKRFAELLRMFQSYQGSPIVSCALRLAPLVFVRPGELRKAEWNRFEISNAEWRFTATKTDTPHIVPLSRQALAILQELHPLTGHGRYLFPSARGNDRPMSDNAILAAMRRLGVSKEETTGHGFRATARTLLDEVLGFRPDYIEHQLAHAVRDPNGRAYNRTAHLVERKKMMQAWADYLDKLKEYVI